METLSFVHFLIICPAVFIAGFIDAIAGGGGLITLPAYLFIGLPAHNAIATNKLSSAMGTAVSTIEYIRDGFVNWKTSVFCVIVTMLGAAIGSNLALLIPEKFFSILMICLLPLVALYVLKNKRFETNKERFSECKTLVLCLISAFFVGMYDGFYGPGTGTFMLLLLTGLARLSLNGAAGTTKIVNLTSNVTALVVFIINGKVIWLLGLIASIFSIAGHFLGAKTFVKNGTKIARPIVILVLIALFIKVACSYVLAFFEAM
ncbi:MAG: TSUP family transporter [Treponemataceae bacterium]|nr:TSUP family transporter [Treponemataceae bacterium]